MVDSAKQRGLDSFFTNYCSALKVGIIVDAVFFVLTALMLDGGRSLQFYTVAIIGHWLWIAVIIGRRPLSPTKIDLVCIRWGVLLLLIVTVLVAPKVWSLIGESNLSGVERMRNI